jgi:hypothetical protein
MLVEDGGGVLGFSLSRAAVVIAEAVEQIYSSSCY